MPAPRALLDEAISTGDRETVRWSAEGTQEGELRGVPASGRRLRFARQTIYELKQGQVAGHWQVVDRMGFLEQLRGQRPPPRWRVDFESSGLWRGSQWQAAPRLAGAPALEA